MRARRQAPGSCFGSRLGPLAVHFPGAALPGPRSQGRAPRAALQGAALQGAAFQGAAFPEGNLSLTIWSGTARGPAASATGPLRLSIRA